MFKIKNLYFYSLLILAVSLPFSHLYTSLSEFLLLGSWLFDKKLLTKLKKIFLRKSVIIFISLFLIHVIWLINTHDFSYAYHDLKLKVPILILPIIIGTSERLDFDKIKIIILGFSFSVFVSSIVSTLFYLNVLGNGFVDIRKISIFISHIRLSLFINVSVFSLFYLLVKKEVSKYKYIIMLLIFWFIFFLFLLQSFTGLIIFLLVSYLFLVYSIFKLKKSYLKFISLFFIIIIPTFIFFYIKNIVNDFYSYKNIDKIQTEKYTVNGNLYDRVVNNKVAENGNFLSDFVCEKELKSEWNKVSKIKYNQKDKKNQYIKYTLKRFLASKGYTKDSLGVSKLTKHEIELINDGCANFIYDNKFGLYPRIYKIIWQIDVYNKTGFFEGHSITQRLFYFKIGLHILKNNFWFGVGTGDVNDEFVNYYKTYYPSIEKRFMRRTHNQFLTFFLTFGVFGFILILIAFFYPVIYEKKYKSYLFVTFLLIILLSTINEDTFETQAGVTFFSYFYSLFLFSKTEK